MKTPRWFRDFCVGMGFVTGYHPWSIDYSARSWVRIYQNEEKQKDIRELIKKRIKELEND
jgi:hypothetical protein